MMAKYSFNPKPKFSMSAGEVLHCLRKLFRSDEWLTVEELFVPGFDRYIDLWAINCKTPDLARRTTRKCFEFLTIHAVEIKVSRADFKAEIDNPNKRLGAVTFSNYYSIACPRGLINRDELPEGVGLIEIHGTKPVMSLYPSYSLAVPPDWAFIASIGRSLWKRG